MAILYEPFTTSLRETQNTDKRVKDFVET